MVDGATETEMGLADGTKADTFPEIAIMIASKTYEISEKDFMVLIISQIDLVSWDAGTLKTLTHSLLKNYSLLLVHRTVHRTVHNSTSST